MALMDQIYTVEDLRALPERDMPKLAQEIREYLVSHVEETGGHLASNLGVVELTLAIHRVFDTPKDHIIWDVGHQAYVHKLVTGRRERFETLRSIGGIAAFPKREESEFDAFGTGHSSTAISAALGFAHATRLQGDDAYSVCVVGDGALTGGLAHEGINNCISDLPLIIIINENEMSISHVTGAFPKLMSRIRTSGKYRRMKHRTIRFLQYIPLIGRPITAMFRGIKNRLRHVFYKANYFEEMGVSYMGPIDGHDYHKVKFILEEAKEKRKTVVVHLRTTKGKGYQPAEEKPVDFHCVYPTHVKGMTYHEVFGEWLTGVAEKDASVCAITPATGDTTGLTAFGETYPDRYFDVGIAESHAMTFSAGLSCSGMRPYVVVYSSFLQRAYDQILHDVALQDLPVKIIIDRASLAPSDGPTHHGIFDVAFLGECPNVQLYAPVTIGSLRAVLADTKDIPHPVAIRYPNGTEDPRVVNAFYPAGDYASYGVRFAKTERAEQVVIVGYGRLISECLSARDALEEEGIGTTVCLVETLFGLDTVRDTILSHTSREAVFVIMEEGIWVGGFAMRFQEALRSSVPSLVCEPLAIHNPFHVPHTACSLFDFHRIGRQACLEVVHRHISKS